MNETNEPQNQKNKSMIIFLILTFFVLFGVLLNKSNEYVNVTSPETFNVTSEALNLTSSEEELSEEDMHKTYVSEFETSVLSLQELSLYQAKACE